MGHVYITTVAQSSSLGDSHFAAGCDRPELFRHEFRQAVFQWGPQAGLIPDDLRAYDPIARPGIMVVRAFRVVAGVRQWNGSGDEKCGYAVLGDGAFCGDADCNCADHGWAGGGEKKYS